MRRRTTDLRDLHAPSGEKCGLPPSETEHDKLTKAFLTRYERVLDGLPAD